CVNRLLEKGYRPENIVLEKTYPSGHGTSGRLDILVNKENSAYLMIECKTYGDKFEEEQKKVQNTGGQLFTYFQQDTKAELLMLYASKLSGKKIISEFRIIKIEEEFRSAGSVKEVHKLWNGTFYEKLFWENPPYNFERQKFTKNNLRELNDIEGLALFNKFATILRKHSVSDKPNAFNKIFNLFLAKLYDERKKSNDELEFHWRDGDHPVDFQVRLFNLHTEGLKAFLEKELAGIYDKDFEGWKTKDELLEKKKNILKINKIYDIKEVFDNDTFEQNHRVLKEIVELLQQYQIRYPRKQRHLSEFFEQLLTTGLKQEAGQFFTPPTIAKFVIKSLPLSKLLEEKINQPAPSLPAAIDYAAGSGHFITEILEEYQDIIEKLDTSDFYPAARQEVSGWKANQYNWAARYVYGIEKDYRLVKVAKVGCYFYGDGLAQVILGDGLDSFEKSKSYVGLLTKNAKKPQFSVLVSNPPYAVDGVKDDLEYIGAQNEFKLFKNLTDKSSEIEALFVERTAQLLETNGVAGIVLPSSILSNEGIYAKAREIILQNFDIVAITQLGGNTFMATNTNTVVLFLRKRDEAEVKRIEEAAYNIAKNYPKTREDLTINGIEKPVKKYMEYTGETEINPEKFYYFVLNYHQKTVIVKTGEKEDEKRFLGYKIVKRRGSEGYHPIQSGKTIDECTKLYDDCENETKTNFYIINAFNKEFPKIHESLKNNVFCVDFIDMLTFDREKFDKSVSLAVKKKVKVESKWDLVKLGQIAQIIRGVTYSKDDQTTDKTNKIILTADNITLDGFLEIKKQVYLNNEFNIPDEKKLKANDIFVCFSSGSKQHLGKVAFIDVNTNYYAGGFMGILRVFKEYNSKYIYLLLNTILRQSVRDVGSGSNINNLSLAINNIKMPLPPREIQEKIVSEIEILGKKEEVAKGKVEKGKEQIENICLQMYSKYGKEKLIQIAKTNPSKTEIAGLDVNTLISFVDMSSVSNDGYIVNKVDRRYSEIKKGSYTYFCDGDIIVAKITPCMENGKCALAANLTNGLALGSSEFHVIRANNDNINTTYLFTLLNRKQIRIEAEKNMTGASGHRRVPIAFYENLEIPLPPLSEQQKVVAKIEKIEAQIAEAQKIIDETAVLKNEVLKKYL
ncbi:MAG: restriction endonuclease subunit S, partial [Chitinivibrionia bacterium]|nr:restriction endonuclease subunit S [Chitinivibrionia bacterium]